MSQERGPAGPQFRADRRQEQEAVRTTIVGGRPPGSGKSVGNIPRGFEVLMKKAAVDPAFKAMLLDRRAEAADEIGLQLEPAEAMMLVAAPREQLEAVIASTHVPDEHRRVFLGKVAAVMLGAVGLVTAGCGETKGSRPDRTQTKGISPDRPPSREKESTPEAPTGGQPDGSDKPKPSDGKQPGKSTKE
jgi:hypothetical protein